MKKYVHLPKSKRGNMFNHQYDFDIDIPKELVTKEKHDKIFTHLLENKVIIGLCGYGKSGKDTIAKRFIDNYGFHRVAFADNIKIEMNKHLKEAVFIDYQLMGIAMKRPVSLEEFSKINVAPRVLEDGRKLTLDMIDFQTEDIPLKKVLRPYIIWYGEQLREINGPYYWINKAMEIDAAGHNNIILSDVRRTKELDIFMHSNAFKRRSELGFAAAGVPGGFPDTKLKSYSSLLFHVSQLRLQDKDVLTQDCIRIAQENWLFDHTFYVDPRIKQSGPYRDNSINFQIKEVAKKFGINKPDKTISNRQTRMF